MLQLILFIIYILLILMVIFVERKRPTEALLWVVIMICLPYVGTILYLIFGSTVAIKLTAAIRKKKLNAQPFDVERMQWDCIEKGQLSESDLQVVQFNTVSLCQFIAGGVDTDKESVKMCYLSMIRSAKKRIRIQSPYFIPDASILDALKTAAASGVEIQLMIPGIKASFFLDPVTNYYSGQLLEYGTKVYKYQGYIHAKTMIIDEELCCIGSVNMDMRSLMVDDEVCGVFYENEPVQRYNQIYEEDITHCTPHTWEVFQKRGRKERMLESIFFLFAPLM